MSVYDDILNQSGDSLEGGSPKNATSRLTEIDENFEPNAAVEFLIFAFMIIYYIPAIVLYIRNRDNLIIKYRQPKSVISGAILSGFNSIITPLIRFFKVPCLFNTWIVNSLVLSFSMITFSRYIRTYFMHKLSIFKLKFSEKKAIKSEKTDYSKSGSIRIKDADKSSNEIKEQVVSVKSSVYTNSSNDEMISNNNMGIIDPTSYFKKLNSIINRKITFYVVIIPVSLILIYTIFITSSNFVDMSKSCVNEHKLVGGPKFAINVAIITSSFYFFYQAYYKQRWDAELKFEYTVFVVVDFICTIVMQLAIFEVVNDTIIKYRTYIFQVYSAIVHLICVIEPLTKIFVSKFRKNKKKLSEEEFLLRLNNLAFRSQVMDIATQTFCVENILFFDAHVDLMNIVINYYSKKSNGPTEPNVSSNVAYNSSDILHKNTLNPSLYKPFDNVFKPQYDQMYNLYIKEDGIASVNIKASTIRAIEDQMANDNYSYLMFNQAAEEIGDLLYNNIYPRMRNEAD